MTEMDAVDLDLANEIGLAEIGTNADADRVLIYKVVLGYEIKWRETVVSEFV